MKPRLISHSPDRLDLTSIASLRPAPRNARTHSKAQIRQIADSIERFGFNNPILIDAEGRVIAGHGRLAAARLLGMERVPTLCLAHLNEAERRAYVLADNKLAEKAGWDRELLALELGELASLLETEDFDLTITGFETAEIDGLLTDFGAPEPEAEDVLPEPGPPAVAPGDLWILGRHRLICADARDPAALTRLMEGQAARMVFIDPPYNVPIVGHVQGRGKIRHREFAFASGEMSAVEFTAFLEAALRLCAEHAMDGSLHYICMDWRHVGELSLAGGRVYDALKNICVWVKSNAGQGSFYRSQHELVFVFKKGLEAHVNTVELGQHGRSRSNVWSYPGVNSFKAGRDDELAMHPTVKPVALVVDAIRDCTHRGDIVLDSFAGSGTTVLAAEKTGRRARAVEIDPVYADVVIRRWLAFTQSDAMLEATGETYAEVTTRRKRERAAPQPAPAAGSELLALAADEDHSWIALGGGEK
ncbi:DNA modification methylase [Pseudochelatococcus lubricantis]|uniref:site-specific DNA-methyltransferase (adenine-specific) n=1 Tax=Pseudochelatococcus lubricantis TaxID=1538102 RepID=A0ABX0UXD0_9HYPH|nr:DNA methyltransferase [Pseudochelatococcus lubricantis]NIJ56939.1 DNA modification methylase [Pseudochelatococcus lubricantis]